MQVICITYYFEGHTYNKYICEIFSKNETSVNMLNEVTKT